MDFCGLIADEFTVHAQLYPFAKTIGGCEMRQVIDFSKKQDVGG